MRRRGAGLRPAKLQDVVPPSPAYSLPLHIIFIWLFFIWWNHPIPFRLRLVKLQIAIRTTLVGAVVKSNLSTRKGEKLCGTPWKLGWTESAVRRAKRQERLRERSSDYASRSPAPTTFARIRKSQSSAKRLEGSGGLGALGRSGRSRQSFAPPSSSSAHFAGLRPGRTESELRSRSPPPLGPLRRDSLVG